MRIESFAFSDKALEWELRPMTFSDLTLLVGISGVGKTQILKALLAVKNIAAGKSRNGVSWDISFRTENGSRYQWEGEFEQKDHFVDRDFLFPDNEESSVRERPNIVRERLQCDGREIVERTAEQIILNGTATPKLPPHSSVLSILNQEDAVTPASDAFKRIVHSDQSEGPRGIRFVEHSMLERLRRRYNSLHDIQESDLDTQLKLALIYQSEKNVFNKIRQRFVEVFPHVLDVKIEPLEDEDFPPFFTETPLIQIRERGVSKWIDQRKISSGMLRTIIHLAEMYLWPSGTVILIDEFENSLGVNCLDVVTEDLLQQHNNLQFVVTSHHPYIINNIGPKYWKVVRREGGRVSTIDATTLGLSESSHEAFIQLINNDMYREGIDIE